MGRVVVDVMPKPEILDPQGKAVAGALPRLGFDEFADVRQGKRFELEVEGEVTAEVLAAGPRGGRHAARPTRSSRTSSSVREATPRRRAASDVCGSASSPSPARWTTSTPRAPYAWPAPSRSRCGTATHDLHGVDAVVLPGGFSYGDYLRCGAIARFAPVMTEVVDAAPSGGLPVLGICNGFQVLCESHLLPGALMRNDHRKFVCRDQRLRIENADDRVDLGVRRRRGDRRSRSRTARAASSPTSATLDRLEGEGRVVVRYVGGNPNGSLRDIAGISNARGNVVGLMPHPEHAVEADVRPRHGRTAASSLGPGRRPVGLTVENARRRRPGWKGAAAGCRQLPGRTGSPYTDIDSCGPDRQQGRTSTVCPRRDGLHARISTVAGRAALRMRISTVARATQGSLTRVVDSCTPERRAVLLALSTVARPLHRYQARFLSTS